MKKILSLLTISAVSLTASSQVISCGKFHQLTLDPSKCIINYYNLYNERYDYHNNDLYNNIYNTLSQWSDSKVAVADMKIDKYITIDIFDKTTNKAVKNNQDWINGLNPSDNATDKPLPSDTYQVTININPKDTYFKVKDNKITSDPINLSKIVKYDNFSAKKITFDDLVGGASTNKDAYDEAYKSLASDINNEMNTGGINISNLTESDLKNDNAYLTLQLYDGSGNKINDSDTGSIAKNEYFQFTIGGTQSSAGFQQISDSAKVYLSPYIYATSKEFADPIKYINS